MSVAQKNTKILQNTAYTMGGALLMNGVLQVLVYPLLNRHMGSSELGNLLFIMGILAIVCPSIGQALNTSRLVVRRDYDVTNGDYDILLIFYSIAGSAAAFVIGWNYARGLVSVLLTFALLFLMVFRYYGDVEYRLNLNYRRYFIYYAVLTAGYILGFGLYFLTGVWFLIFMTGEAACLIYLALTGSLFKNFFARSEWFDVAMRRGSFLILSYVVTNLTLNIDRLALRFLIDDLAVTQYYVVSLIGKTMLLVVAPVNTIMISYLTKRKERMKKGEYLKLVGAGFAVAAVFFAAAEIATPIFLRLFYFNLYEGVKGIIHIVNLSQILGLLSAYLFIIVLTFTEEKWQMILQILHLAVICALILIMTHGSIRGFSLAVLIANAARVIIVTLFGLVRVGKAKDASRLKEDY